MVVSMPSPPLVPVSVELLLPMLMPSPLPGLPGFVLLLLPMLMPSPPAPPAPPPPSLSSSPPPPPPRLTPARFVAIPSANAACRYHTIARSSSAVGGGRRASVVAVGWNTTGQC